MAKKTLGYAELQWTCPNCGGINPGPEKVCTQCGAPQPEDVQFEQAERLELTQDEAVKARVKAGPDIHCPYCEARNPGDAETCSQCGGDLSGGVRRESGRVVGAFETGPAKMVVCLHCGAENLDTVKTCSQCGGSMYTPKEEGPARLGQVTAPPAGAKQGKKRVPIGLIIFLVGICAAAAIFVFLSIRTETLTGTVQGVGWERSIAIEDRGLVQHSDWQDQLPQDAKVISCKQEERSVQSEPAPNATEVCGTPYSVDTGSGYAEVVQDCEYHIYDDYCTYSVLEWSVVDTASLSGNDYYPEWPDPIITADQRLGEQTEEYKIYFDTSEGDYTYTTDDFGTFQQFQIGTQWVLEVNTFGAVVSVEP